MNNWKVKKEDEGPADMWILWSYLTMYQTAGMEWGTK